MMTRLLRTAPAALAALAVLLGLGWAPSYAAHPQGPAVGVPAAAGAPTAGVAGVDGPAGGLGGNSIFTAFATRSRVVQFCAVAMCLALFILVKKFAEPGSAPAVRPADGRPRPPQPD